MQQKYAKIEGYSYLLRDLQTNAILNTDPVAVKKHEKRLQDLQKEEYREMELNNIKQDILEIKSMIRELVSSKSL